MRINVGDVELYFTASTQHTWDAERPVILGLHGGPGVDGSQLRYVLAPAQEWATVVVPDQRGHGRSDRSASGAWNLAQWSADLELFIAALHLENVIVVGTSFGGFVAQYFMAHHPDIARAAVIVGASPRRASAEDLVQRYRDLGGELAAQMMRRVLTDHSAEAEADWTRVCGPLVRVRPPGLELTHIQEAQIATPQVNEHFMSVLPDLDLRPDLAAVTKPLLVLVGEKDPLTPADSAREIQEHATSSDVTFRLVSGAGHQVFWDQPEESHRLLKEFAQTIGLHRAAPHDFARGDEGA
jgi:pimeloyl-ACP methyl ester carboxylesterase